MQSAELIDFFLDNLRHERRLSSHTTLAYEKDIKQFWAFLEKNFDQVELSKTQHSEIRQWIISLSDSQIGPRTINRKIASLRSFYNYLRKQGKVSVNPTSRIQGLKTPEKPPTFIEERSLTEIFDQLTFTDDFEGVRDKVIVLLLYGSGIRLSELISLLGKDVDFASNKIKVLGKRSKYRLVPLTESLIHLLKEYKSKRDEQGINSPEFLTRLNGEALYPVLVQRVVKKHLSAITSIAQKSPHILRHSYATHLLNAGAELNAIKDLLGHSSLAATQVYTHNSIEKLKEVHKNAHPKSKG